MTVKQSYRSNLPSHTMVQWWTSLDRWPSETPWRPRPCSAAGLLVFSLYRWYGVLTIIPTVIHELASDFVNQTRPSHRVPWSLSSRPHPKQVHVISAVIQANPITAHFAACRNLALLIFSLWPIQKNTMEPSQKWILNNTTTNSHSTKLSATAKCTPNSNVHLSNQEYYFISLSINPHKFTPTVV